MTWLDVTFRAEAKADVTELPEGTIEFSWPAPDASRFTVLLTRAEAEELLGDLASLLTAPREEAAVG